MLVSVRSREVRHSAVRVCLEELLIEPVSYRESVPFYTPTGKHWL